MLLALVYSVLRLLLDLVDVRRRVDDPEVELLLLHEVGLADSLSQLATSPPGR
jgi:hypothetical protein